MLDQILEKLYNIVDLSHRRHLVKKLEKAEKQEESEGRLLIKYGYYFSYNTEKDIAKFLERVLKNRFGG